MSQFALKKCVECGTPTSGKDSICVFCEREKREASDDGLHVCPDCQMRWHCGELNCFHRYAIQCESCYFLRHEKAV